LLALALALVLALALALAVALASSSGKTGIRNCKPPKICVPFPPFDNHHGRFYSGSTSNSCPASALARSNTAMAGRFVRSSKYRHVYGQPTKRVGFELDPS
jgi:hypothetical protein